MAIQNQALAQELSVSGVVTDSESGEPLIGVNVLLQGTSRGTMTDFDGNYTIVVPNEESVLIFSFLGYTADTVRVGSQKQIDVALTPDFATLDEVLVVGYGTQDRATLTGSVSQIGGEDVRKAPTMNISNTLAGRLPGLVARQSSGRPGADDSSLLIRGMNTTGGNRPLMIVDGVERDFFNLDPNEIESISILKDASAAVYGVKAANGVILVTTKSGEKGKPTITYNTSVAANSNTRFPEFLSGPDYMYWTQRGEEMDNAYLIATGKDPIPYTYTDEQIEALRNGTHSEDFGNTDWVRDLVDNVSMNQHHNITISGGTEKVVYFTSLGYFNQDGVVENTDFTRYNLRTKLDFQFNDYLSANLNVGARMEERNNPALVASNSAGSNPFSQAVRSIPNLPATYNGLPTAAYRSGTGMNPIAAVERSGYNRSKRGVFQTNLSFNLKIPQVEGLNLKLLTAYDKSMTESKRWTTPYELAVRRLTSSGPVWSTSYPPGITTTTLRQGLSNVVQGTFQPSINYDRTFGDHSLGALLLYEYSRYSNNSFTAGARNFPLSNIQELDFGSEAPEDFVAPIGSSNVDSRSGYVGRIKYDFKDKYLLELAARYDGSSRFPEHNRWGFFPSLSAGWVLSREDFFEELDGPLSFLKIKGSWGKLGNDNTSQYQYLNTFSLTSNPVVVIGGQPQAALFTNNPANLNLTWETTTMTNVGLESSFWNGKLDFNFEWFYNVTHDILRGQGGIFPPSIGGFYPSTVNAGIVDNRGFDLQITHRNDIGDFHYGITGNVNFARNKIIDIDDSENIPEWQKRSGRSMGEKMGFISEGLFQSWEEVENWASSPSGAAAPGFIKYKDLNGDGQINQQDLTFIGKSNIPEVMFGINLDLDYRAFDFSALFQGASLADVALGGMYEGSAGTSGVTDNTPFTRTFYSFGNSPYYLVENSWTPDNPNAYYPRLQAYRSGAPNHNGWANSRYVVDGSYLRLKSAQLGYTINPQLLKEMQVERWRIYISGSNLFTWSSSLLKYLDPEMPNVTNGFYPQQRIISVGMNLTF